MKCDEVLQVLAEYRCGELDAESAKGVEAHLTSCSSCSRELEVLSREDQAYREYQQEVEQGLEVTPGMWRGIQDALGTVPSERRRTAIWRQVLLAAALVVISVGATLLTVRYFESGRLRDAAEGHARPEKSTTLADALRSIERAEQEYTDAIRVLSEIVDKRKSAMDPQLVAELEASLKAIDENIAATRKAYHEHPTNADLAHYMLAAYNRKVELLQHLTS